MMTNSYKQQRYERLSEVLDEYIACSGDECGMDFFIRDVKKALLDMRCYHEKVTDDCVLLADLLGG
jgi:hypothetical protein